MLKFCIRVVSYASSWLDIAENTTGCTISATDLWNKYKKISMQSVDMKAYK